MLDASGISIRAGPQDFERRAWKRGFTEIDEDKIDDAVWRYYG